MNDDARLIDETLAGDRTAFGELVRKYQVRLFNTLLHVVGSREEAEDVSQEAFVQAFVKLDSFKGHSAFYTWLYRIAFNVSISRAAGGSGRRFRWNCIGSARGTSRKTRGRARASNCCERNRCGRCVQRSTR